MNHLTKPAVVCPQCARLPQFRPCSPIAWVCGLCGRIEFPIPKVPPKENQCTNH